MVDTTLRNTVVAKEKIQQRILMIVPFVVLISMLIIFRFLTINFGSKVGWLGGMIVYWGVWCLAFPIKFLGWAEVKEMFTTTRWAMPKPVWLGVLALLFPPAMAILFGPFFGRVGGATIWIFLLSGVISLVNATLEELLWRGVYYRVFPKQMLKGYLYSSFGFAIWHLAPVSANFSLAGVLSLVGGGFVIALCWGFVMWRTGSLKWNVISHCIVDFSGLIAVTLLA